MQQDMIQAIQEQMRDNLDFKSREILCCGREVTLFFLSSLSDANYISEAIVTPLMKAEKRLSTPQAFANTLLTCSIGGVKNIEEALHQIMIGNTLLVIPSLNLMLHCGTRKAPKRSIEKSDMDANLKGSRESFNETFLDSIGLIRKRANTPHLKVIKMSLGRVSKTESAIVYLDNVAPKELVKHVREKMEHMNNDFVLGVNYVSEALKTDRSLFETSNYTEKPDTVVAGLFEGRVAIIVAGTPYVLVAPYFFIESFHSPDDYYSNRFESFFIRTLRLAAILVALLLPGLFVVLTTEHYSLIPTTFIFKLAVSRAGVPFPTVIEMILMQFFFELSREAGKRLPLQIGQSLSVVAGLILGESAVGVGLASQATVVVTGIYAICSFINPKLIGTMLVWSLFVTGLSVLFGLHGFYLAFLMFLAEISSLRSVGYPYMFPFGTVKNYKFRSMDILYRGPLKNISRGFLKQGHEDRTK